MAQSSTTLHESDLSPDVVDRHRAIVSLMEELEAVDWYDQRVQAATDDELKRTLAAWLHVTDGCTAAEQNAAHSLFLERLVPAPQRERVVRALIKKGLMNEPHPRIPGQRGRKTRQIDSAYHAFRNA